MSILCSWEFATCQLMVGNALETPIFLSSGYIPYFGKEHVQVFGSYAFQKGGYPRYGALGIRYSRPVPKWGNSHIAFGGYMQDYNLGSNFFGLRNTGINFAISIPFLNEKTLILIGAGGYWQKWKANWSLFKPFEYFSIRHGINSLEQIEPFKDIKEHSAGDVSVSWNVQREISSTVNISFGVEGKKLARHSIFPGTTLDQYKTPVDVIYYLKTSWGKQFGTEETEKKMTFDVFGAVNTVADKYVNIFYPVVNSPHVLSSGQMLGAGAHFKLTPEYLVYFAALNGGDLNPLNPPVTDTIPQKGRHWTGINLRIDHFVEEVLWSLGVGYYTSALYPGPKSHMFNVNLSLMIFHPREGIPIKCITKPFVKAKLKFRRRRY